MRLSAEQWNTVSAGLSRAAELADRVMAGELAERDGVDAITETLVAVGRGCGANLRPYSRAIRAAFGFGPDVRRRTGTG